MLTRLIQSAIDAALDRLIYRGTVTAIDGNLIYVRRLGAADDDGRGYARARSYGDADVGDDVIVLSLGETVGRFVLCALAR